MTMRLFLASCAGLALLTVPVSIAAQDEMAESSEATEPTAEEAELESIMRMFSGMFTAEPLTSDQESRIPAAQQLVAKVIPEGMMSEMMDKLFEGLLSPIMTAAPTNPGAIVARQIGTEATALDEEQADALATLFDPAWAERQQREMAMFPDMMTSVVNLMEPGMRKAMSEFYAIRFSSGELAEIDAFFSTGAGSKYARESFLMASDPRMKASTMETLPALIGMFSEIETRMAETMADLPAVRSFADLTPAERAKVAEMTGYSVEEIEANLGGIYYGVEEAELAVE